MKISCGAILYTYNENKELGIILGLERQGWFPFKGCMKTGETYLQTAIREICEETCGLLKVTDKDFIHDWHTFETKRKEYHISLLYAPYSIIEEFKKKREEEDRAEFVEKDCIRFFPFHDKILTENIHNITKISILYYWNILCKLREENNIPYNKRYFNSRIRKHSVGLKFAKKNYDIFNLQNREKSPISSCAKNKKWKFSNNPVIPDNLKIWRNENIIPLRISA